MTDSFRQASDNDARPTGGCGVDGTGGAGCVNGDRKGITRLHKIMVDQENENGTN